MRILSAATVVATFAASACWLVKHHYVLAGVSGLSGTLWLISATLRWNTPRA
jgi:hypothetical protein